MKLKKIPTSIKVVIASMLVLILTLGIMKATSVFAEPALEDLVKERDYGTLQVDDKIDWENNSEEDLKVVNQLNNKQVFVQLDAWKDTNGDKKITLDDVLYNRGKEDSEKSAEYLAENIWSTDGGGMVCDYGSDKYYVVLLVDVDRWNNTVCTDITLGLNSVSGSVLKKSDYWFDTEHSCLYVKKDSVDSNDDTGLRCQTTYVCKNLNDVSKNMPVIVTFDEKLTDAQKETAQKAIKTSSVEIKSIVFNDDRVKFDIINDKNTILFNKDCLEIFVNGYSKAEFTFDEVTGEVQLDPQIKLSDIYFVGINVKDVNEISNADKNIYEQQTQTAKAAYDIGWGDLPNSGITVKYNEGAVPQVGDYKLLEFQGWAGYDSLDDTDNNDIEFLDNWKNPVSGAFTKRVCKWYSEYKKNGHKSNVAFVPFGEFTSSTVFYKIRDLVNNPAGSAAAKDAGNWFLIDSNMKNINKVKRITKVLCWDYNYRYIGQITGMKKNSENQSVNLLPNAWTTGNSEPFFTCTCMHINRRYYTLNGDHDFGTDFSGAIVIAGISENPNRDGGTLRCMIIPQRANTNQSFSQRVLGFANITYQTQQKGKLTITKSGESANIAIGRNQDELNACKKNANYQLEPAKSNLTATFRIFSSIENAKNNNPISFNGSTDVPSGHQVELRQGTYYIKEVTPPKNYAYTKDTLTKVVVKANESKTLPISNPKQNLYLRMNAKDLTTYSLGDKAQTLGGLKFEVKTTVKTKVNGKEVSKDVSATAQTRDDGVLYFNLPCGYNYTITQVDTITNYSMADNVEQSLNEDSNEKHSSSANTITVTQSAYDSNNQRYTYNITGIEEKELKTIYWYPYNGKNPGQGDGGGYSWFNHWEPRQYVTIKSQVQNPLEDGGPELTPAVVKKEPKTVAEFKITPEYAENGGAEFHSQVYSVHSEYALYTNSDIKMNGQIVIPRNSQLELTGITDGFGELNEENGTCISKRYDKNRNFISAKSFKYKGKQYDSLPEGSYKWVTCGLETYNAEESFDNRACDVQTIGAKYKLLTNSDIFLGYNENGDKVTVGPNNTLTIVGVEYGDNQVPYGKASDGSCESTEYSNEKAYISAVKVKYDDGHTYKIPNGRYQWELQKPSKGYYLNENSKTFLIDDTVWSRNKIKSALIKTEKPVTEDRQTAEVKVFAKGYSKHDDLEEFNDKATNKMEWLGFGKTSEGYIMHGDVNYYTVNNGKQNIITVTNIKATQNGRTENRDSESFEVKPDNNLSGAVFAIFNTSDIVTTNGQIIEGHSEDEIINMYTKIKLGDVDYDDWTDTIDITHIQRHMSGMYKFLPYQELIADVNCDGVINGVDTDLIQKWEVGLPVNFADKEQEMTVGLKKSVSPIGYYSSDKDKGTLISRLNSDAFEHKDNLGNVQKFDAVQYMQDNTLDKLPLGSYMLVEVLAPKDDDKHQYDIESWFEKEQFIVPWSTETVNKNTVSTTKTLAFYAPNPANVVNTPIAPDPVWPTEPTNPAEPNNPYVEHEDDDPYDPDNPDDPNNPDDSNDIPVADPDWVNKHYNDKSYRIVDNDNVVDTQHLVQDMLPAEFAFVINDEINSSRITDYYTFFYYEITQDEYENQKDSGKDFEYMTFKDKYFRRFEYSDNQNIEGGSNSVGARSLTSTIVLNEKSKGFQGYNLSLPNKTVSGAIKDVKWLNEKLTNNYYNGEYHIAVGVMVSTKRSIGGTVYETRRMIMDDVLTIKARQLFKLD